MKKMFIALVCALATAACNQSGENRTYNNDVSPEDSLQVHQQLRIVIIAADGDPVIIGGPIIIGSGDKKLDDKKLDLNEFSVGTPLIGGSKKMDAANMLDSFEGVILS